MAGARAPLSPEGDPVSNVVQLRKPCPFCGEQGEFEPDQFCIQCEGCSATGPGVGGCDVGDDHGDLSPTIEAAAWAFWNKREPTNGR